MTEKPDTGQLLHAFCSCSVGHSIFCHESLHSCRYASFEWLALQTSYDWRCTPIYSSLQTNTIPQAVLLLRRKDICHTQETHRK